MNIPNLLIILVIGGVIGWLASIVMRTDAQQGIILNIIVGIVGALLAGIIITPFVNDGGTIMSGNLGITSLLISFVGAVVLLGIVNLIRRGSVR